MSVSKSSDSISSMLKIGKYSDRDNTDLENGIEYGFGFVLGGSAAILLMVLMFLIVKAVF